MNFQDQESEKVDVDGHTEHNSAPAVNENNILYQLSPNKLKIIIKNFKNLFLKSYN